MDGYMLFDTIPQDCMECDFCIDDDCALQNEIYVYFEEQKKHCPIRPLPREKKRSYKKGYKSGYNDG